MNSKLILSALLLSSVVDAKLFFGKGCEHPDLEQEFDINRYLGVWYEIYKDPSFYWEKGGECTTATYTLKDDGNVNVYNS